MKNSQLAIVIPAYKGDFFEKTLASIAAQTNKNFSLYIGDDHSPHELEQIVNKYRNKINLSYVRFDTNLGSINLVKQWERCIALTKGEHWIWLFSDDDYMDPICVESFWNAVKNRHFIDLYRFNVGIVDREDHLIKQATYPPQIDSYSFYKKKVLCRLDCFVVEYIFSRDVYKEQGGFVEFDMAWGSDVATWVKFSSRNGIHTLQEGKVYWRSSGLNISTTISEVAQQRKIAALINFLHWGKAYFKLQKKNVSLINDIGFSVRMRNFSKEMGWNSVNKGMKEYAGSYVHYFLITGFTQLFTLYFKCKSFFRK